MECDLALVALFVLDFKGSSISALRLSVSLQNGPVPIMVILNTFVNSLLYYSYNIESLQSLELVFVHPSIHFLLSILNFSVGRSLNKERFLNKPEKTHTDIERTYKKNKTRRHDLLAARTRQKEPENQTPALQDLLVCCIAAKM